MGALYLASKLEECPVRMRDLINVYDLLLAKAEHELSSRSGSPFKYTPMGYFGNTFYDMKVPAGQRGQLSARAMQKATVLRSTTSPGRLRPSPHRNTYVHQFINLDQYIELHNRNAYKLLSTNYTYIYGALFLIRSSVYFAECFRA